MQAMRSCDELYSICAVSRDTLTFDPELKKGGYRRPLDAGGSEKPLILIPWPNACANVSKRD